MKGTKKVVMSIMVLCLVLVGLLTPEKAYAKSDSDFVIENGVLTEYQGSGGDVIIPDGVKEIGSRAFYYCSSLTSVVIPDGVTTIGDSAFYYCSSLTSVVIPDGVTTIGDSAFGFCSSLTSVVIPDGVTTIGDGAFERCNSLTSIKIPDSVTEIGSGAFWGCSKLKEFTIPKNVTKLGREILYACDSLKKITILSKKVSLIETRSTSFYTSEKLGDYLTALLGDSRGEDGTPRIKNPRKILTIYGYKYSTADEFVTRMNTLRVTDKIFKVKSLKFVPLDKNNTTLDKIKVSKSITITKGKSKKLSIQLPSNLKRVKKFTKKQGQVKVSITYSKETFKEPGFYYNIKKVSNDSIKATKKGTGYAYTIVALPNGDKKVFATKVVVK